MVDFYCYVKIFKTAIWDFIFVLDKYMQIYAKKIEMLWFFLISIQRA